MSLKPAQSSQPEGDDEIDLVALLHRLWGGKKWILASTGLAGLVGLVIALGTAPTYRADALLQLEEKSGQMALPAGLSDMMGSQPRSVTEIEIIGSRLVLGQAVAEAHLDWQVEPAELPILLNVLTKIGAPIPDAFGLARFARGDDAIRVDLLEVPPAWLDEPMRVTLGEGRAYTIELPDGTLREGQVGSTLSDPGLGFALRVGEISGEAGREFTVSHRSETAAIEALRERLTVSERGRQSSILELGLTGGNPALAERQLRAIAEAYLRQNVSRSSAEAESSLIFVEGQLPNAEAAVRSAEKALNAYREEHKAIDLSFEGQTLLSQVNSLEAELQKLATEEDALAERYTPNHPAYQQLLGEKARLQERLGSLRSEIGSLPQTQRTVLNLTRDLEMAQEVYVQLMNRTQELRVLKASTIGNVRIVDQARAAKLPIAPRKSRILALSLVLGVVLGAAGVLIRNMLNRGVQSAEEIEAIGLSVFATINHLKEAERHRESRRHVPIHAITTPHDRAIEGLRSMRTGLHFCMVDAKTRTLAVTSPSPGVGKSFLVANLGAVAAQGGQRVCVVDADLRRGYLRRYFGQAKGRVGLSEYLAGEATLDEILVPGPIDGLTMIPTGQYPPNPSELLMRERFDELVKDLDQRFDLSIFDTPPVLAVTDPIIIAKAVGATIAVARFDLTPVGEMEALQRQFRNAGLKLAGAVLNGFDPRRAASRNGYSYTYSYSYDYKRRDE